MECDRVLWGGGVATPWSARRGGRGGIASAPLNMATGKWPREEQQKAPSHFFACFRPNVFNHVCISSGNGRHTVSRALFQRRELTEFCGKLCEFCEKLGELAVRDR